MEISSKNSSDLSQYLFQIQEIKKTPKKTDTLFAENRNENTTKNTRYLSYCDFPSSSTSRYNQENMYDRNTEMILLKRKAGGYHNELNPLVNRWIIDLSDSDSKMALRRHLGEMAECGNSNSSSTATEYNNMEMLQKLPSDTVVIRQQAKINSENCDYGETNDSGSSSSCATTKMKRISRTIKNKSEAIEVRRNPMRVSKKNFTRDFSQSKQQLLAKRDVCLNYESGKRMRSSPMPYMNTRSVTRKMYTVGATYQAPTKRDETEWKEWPVHGMHERPVYHPQAGLAVEYLGRYFTSLDGLSYCEILDQPEIEIVAVDPHVSDQSVSSTEKKPSKEKTRANSKRSSSAADSWSAFLSPENKSFDTCMHGSLHYVLGYCSQIMSPTYKRAIEEKIMNLTDPVAKTSFLNSEETCNKNSVANSSENVSKNAEDTNLLEAYAIAIAHSVRNKSVVSNANNRKTVSNLPSSSAVYMPETQTSPVEIDNSKIGSQPSGEITRMNLKQILQDASNSSLILLRSSTSKASESQVRAANDVSDPIQLESTAVSNDTLMEMSSIYKSGRACSNEPACGCKESSTWNNLYNLKRQALDTQKYPTKKTFLLESPKESNKISLQTANKTHENRSVDEVKINAENSSGRLSAASSNKSRGWSTSKTSEIARILSEYNKTMTRKSTIHNQIYNSRSIKPNLTTSSALNLSKSLWRKDVTAEKNRNFVTDTNRNFNFSQGKWKRFYLTQDQIKNTRATNQNAWHGCSTSLENYPSSLSNRANLSVLNCTKEKPVEFHNDLNKHEVADAKEKETKSGYSMDETSIARTKSMQELLENTAILYCAANGVHQDDLSTYIDTLDAKQSAEWLEEWKNSVV
ncbi:uncharacterized protein LOC109861187 [Pseudomyrmex gracilis]|uniref:uncharacterized protein LOC109861187 n=1 Tax=Pseudomyrmex gracilis TaxID=219809 RepID=UPI000994A2C0|nr:uncharacterized protein LOC109861187 [Pseudomyrmex gracilis]XP_020296319.1 uncharacterized protein LOC109861187 [Pseudomyrmex gracilis]XP_020296320.1 uncharacterized protein LOC109861187 [Pseudomyrmex gracilis]